MSEVNYNADLDQVIAYAAAPAEGVGSFVRAADGQPVHFDNPHDRVLQDYLEDHDDPRHEIVRRELERSKNPNASVVGDLHKLLQSGPSGLTPTVHNTYPLPNGNLHITGYTNRSNGMNGSMVVWEAAHPDGGSGRTYRAAMSPAEVGHLIKNLPLEGNGGLPVRVE